MCGVRVRCVYHHQKCLSASSFDSVFSSAAARADKRRKVAKLLTRGLTNIQTDLLLATHSAIKLERDEAGEKKMAKPLSTNKTMIDWWATKIQTWMCFPLERAYNGIV